jgi:hypothetical protein
MPLPVVRWNRPRAWGGESPIRRLPPLTVAVVVLSPSRLALLEPALSLAPARPLRALKGRLRLRPRLQAPSGSLHFRRHLRSLDPRRPHGRTR